MYLDDFKSLHLIENESFTFQPSIDRYKECPFFIEITSVTSTSYAGTLIRGDFAFSSYDEDTDDYSSIALLLNNVYISNVTKTQSLVMFMILSHAYYYGQLKATQIIMVHKSSADLESTILPNIAIKADLYMSYLTTDFPILVMDSTDSFFESNLITSEESNIKNLTFTGNFEPLRDCIISNCSFDKLDTDKYYSDAAEAEGIYFYNCMLNNKPLDSYNRFKVIE